MKREEEQIHRAVISHLNARSMPGVYAYSKGNRWLNETIAQRFDRFTIPEPNSGCLLWLGSVDHNGYGQLRVEGRSKFASHIALELDGRPVPKGRCALHKCDNPSCVEAAHLFVGTQLLNMMDMNRKGRGNQSGLARGWGWNAKN